MEINDTRRNTQMTNELESRRTELDFKYYWKCQECDFSSFIMFDADTHQYETDHCMTRIDSDHI